MQLSDFTDIAAGVLKDKEFKTFLKTLQKINDKAKDHPDLFDLLLNRSQNQVRNAQILNDLNWEVDNLVRVYS
jgi:hypothetical protein